MENENVYPYGDMEMYGSLGMSGSLPLGENLIKFANRLNQVLYAPLTVDIDQFTFTVCGLSGDKTVGNSLLVDMDINDRGEGRLWAKEIPMSPLQAVSELISSCNDLAPAEASEGYEFYSAAREAMERFVDQYAGIRLQCTDAAFVRENLFGNGLEAVDGNRDTFSQIVTACAANCVEFITVDRVALLASEHREKLQEFEERFGRNDDDGERG